MYTIVSFGELNKNCLFSHTHTHSSICTYLFMLARIRVKVVSIYALCRFLTIGFYSVYTPVFSYYFFYSCVEECICTLNKSSLVKLNRYESLLLY